MKKRIAGLLLALVLCLTLLPAAASAADGDDVLYVGGVELSAGADEPVYARTDEDGRVTPGGCERDYNVKWDGVTLTLRNAYISGGYETTPDFTKGIYFKGSLNLVLIGTNTVTRTAEAQAYYHVTGISVGSDLSITGSGDTSRLIIGGSDAAKYGSDGIDAGSSLYIKDCVVQANGHGEIEPGYTGICAKDELVIENSSVTAASTGFGCGINLSYGDIRIDEASHVTAASEAAGGAVKLSEYGSLYIGNTAYELDAGAAKLEVKDGAVTEGAKIITPAELYVNGMDILTAADNTVSCGEGSAVYNPAANTLTLNNAEINAEQYGCGIFADGPLVINLSGKNKIVGGGLFSPDDSITREQLAVILYRFALYKGYDVSAGEDFDLSAYADAGDVSEWAIPAMQWACGAGIISGDGEGSLAPQGEATRAQVAAMLMRFIESV